MQTLIMYTAVHPLTFGQVGVCPAANVFLYQL